MGKLEELIESLLPMYSVASMKKKEIIINEIISKIKKSTSNNLIRKKISRKFKERITEIIDFYNNMMSIGVNTPSCENSRISNPIDFVAACISEGIGFSQGRRFLVKIGVIPPSQSACYKNQLRLEEETKVLGKESCLRNVIGINSPRSISFDGVWSHARNASHCMGTFIDQVTGKIIDCYKVQIDFNGQRKLLRTFTRDGNENTRNTK